MSLPAFQGRLETEEWSIYQAACSRATTGYYPTVTVCPGEELATKEIPEWWVLPTGHLLSYASSSYTASYGTCQDLINRTTGNARFGAIAHPFNAACRWSDWNATPWRGIEVASNQSYEDSGAVSQWDQKLLSALPAEIAGSVRHVAMSNSDVHSSSSAGWGANINYIYTGSYAAPGTSPDVVWNAIRQGEVTASTDGSFAAATVKGTYPGHTLSVARNSTVSVSVTGTPVSSSYTFARVEVRRNGYVEKTSPLISLNGSNFSWLTSLQIPVDSYVRVDVLYGNGSTWSGICLVNPVFIYTY